MTDPSSSLHSHSPRKNKRRALRITLISIVAVFVLAIAVIGIYAISLSNTFNNIEKIENPFPDDTLRPTPSPVPKGDSVSQNILLVGSDTRGVIGSDIDNIWGSRSDTMLLVHIPSDRKSIQVMSFMRDFWVDIPGHGKAKLNAAMSWGGPALLIQTLESIIDVRIDHIAIVDFEGFEGITGALDGVTVDNQKKFNAGGYDFPVGEITLQGEQALRYVRERYSFVDGDYQRVRNQQAFIKAVMAKVLSTETLTNPVKISNLVNSVVPYLAVDDGIDSNYAIGLGYELRDVRVANARFFTIPTLGTGTVQGQSIVHVDWDELDKIKAALQSDTLSDYVPPADQ